jgi:hypothetical protein
VYSGLLKNARKREGLLFKVLKGKEKESTRKEFYIQKNYSSKLMKYKDFLKHCQHLFACKNTLINFLCRNHGLT